MTLFDPTIVYSSCSLVSVLPVVYRLYLVIQVLNEGLSSSVSLIHDGSVVSFSEVVILSIAITTVGYGEITPRSFLGRLITVPLLVFGLLLIALPSFVLGREFSIVWESMTGHEHEVRHRKQIHEQANTNLYPHRLILKLWILLLPLSRSIVSTLNQSLNGTFQIESSRKIKQN